MSAELTRAALRQIEAGLSAPPDLDMLAASLHYSKSYLVHRFSADTGQPPQAYWQRRSLTEAARALTGSSRPILQLALDAGFSSQQAFSTRFKALYKCTPAEFRTRGKFYPLQLPLELDTVRAVPASAELADFADIPAWLALLHLSVDGFPCLEEADYRRKLTEAIRQRKALIVRGGKAALGAVIFSHETGHIEFFTVHPQYRGGKVERILLRETARRCACPLSLTTYRSGDRADAGWRRPLLALGFVPGELLTEFGYPTQRLYLPEGVL